MAATEITYTDVIEGDAAAARRWLARTAGLAVALSDDDGIVLYDASARALVRLDDDELGVWGARLRRRGAAADYAAWVGEAWSEEPSEADLRAIAEDESADDDVRSAAAGALGIAEE